jgi:hypothetical protein
LRVDAGLRALLLAVQARGHLRLLLVEALAALAGDGGHRLCAARVHCAVLRGHLRAAGGDRLGSLLALLAQTVRGARRHAAQLIRRIAEVSDLVRRVAADLAGRLGLGVGGLRRRAPDRSLLRADRARLLRVGRDLAVDLRGRCVRCCGRLLRTVVAGLLRPRLAPGERRAGRCHGLGVPRRERCPLGGRMSADGGLRLRRAGGDVAARPGERLAHPGLLGHAGGLDRSVLRRRRCGDVLGAVLDLRVHPRAARRSCGVDVRQRDPRALVLRPGGNRDGQLGGSRRVGAVRGLGLVSLGGVPGM